MLFRKYTKIWNSQCSILFLRYLFSKRKPIVHNGIRTNICIHVRYSEEDSESFMHETNAYNVNASGVAFTIKRLRARMIDLLSDAKDNVMYSDDILSALVKTNKDKKLAKDAINNINRRLISYTKF